MSFTRRVPSSAPQLATLARPSKQATAYEYQARSMLAGQGRRSWGNALHQLNDYTESVGSHQDSNRSSFQVFPAYDGEREHVEHLSMRTPSTVFFVLPNDIFLAGLEIRSNGTANQPSPRSPEIKARMTENILFFLRSRRSMTGQGNHAV
ncbi:hypothetical protein TWF569_011718 [Orbilia oligospora]|uniref:Uncharacterized protein n=1 Tax=Orbilia oligospora TaxID=2813651 RepID=A0A7C8JH02_ORBOL|nr:hypothetical protein TWF706_002435 [Orbilia oligospora]KAF3086529.1 hypothetical protein TWF103_001744 [Orbilia oligospora]KAF3091260.1 hypothetical protein TWF102_008815 [Orbilia oligospora]KAF3127570.1 hypothetical protein TWF569_011718 [Orbilia oligospora]KAF3145345.1 hypothetical protein TWF594_004292 [Orbilia oligospora]